MRWDQNFFKNKATWPLPRPLGVVYHPKANTWYILTVKIDNSRFGCSRDMIASVETENYWCDPDQAPFKVGLSTVS